MTLEEEFDPKQVVPEVHAGFTKRLAQRPDLPPDEVAKMLDFLGRMAGVACNLIFQERAIQVPNSEQTVPFDGVSARRTLDLFCEGLYFAMFKCYEMRIEEAEKGQFLQSVAQYVYDNAKQIVLSTYGQEHTPEYQIPAAQQIEMISQTAESGLLFFISEYEKENGPVPLISDEPAEPQTGEKQPTEPDAVAPEASAAPQAAEATPAPQASVAQTPQPAAQNAALPKAPPEKYAALALFFRSISPARAEALYAKFSPPEQQLIQFFSLPENLEGRVDLTVVLHHLEQLQARLNPGSVQAIERSATWQVLQTLLATPSPVTVRSWVQAERPALQQTVEALLASATSAEADSLPPQVDLSRVPSLPPGVETALLGYLQQKIGALAPQQQATGQGPQPVRGVAS